MAGYSPSAVMATAATGGCSGRANHANSFLLSWYLLREPVSARQRARASPVSGLELFRGSHRGGWS